MSPSPACIVAVLALAFGVVASEARAWPFGPVKPAAATQPSTSTPSKSGPRKATPEQRAAADRLDPLSRSAFWAKEVDQDPTDVEAQTQLAVALRLLGRYPEAIQAAGKVLILDPKNMTALLETGRAYIGENQGFYALDPLKRAAALAPGDWRPVSLLGVAREQNRQPDEAHAAYLQALALSPNNPAVLTNLALWCAKRRDVAQAEALLRRAVAQPGATAAERQNLALVLGLQGKIADAEKIMRDDLPPDVADNNLSYLRAVSGVTR